MNPIHPEMRDASCLRITVLAVRCTILTIFLCLPPSHGLAQDSPENEPDIHQLMQGKAFIYHLYLKDGAGKGYKLVYMVAAPLRVYWKFKTDFGNDFLLTNKLINEPFSYIVFCF